MILINAHLIFSPTLTEECEKVEGKSNVLKTNLDTSDAGEGSIEISWFVLLASPLNCSCRSS